MTFQYAKRAGRVLHRVIVGWVILFAFVLFVFADYCRRLATE